jgi:hypothetical protein
MIPLPLSFGTSGNLKQKMHLKSSIERFAALGLYKIIFLEFIVFWPLVRGFLAVVLVEVLVLELLVCLCDVGVDLEELETDREVRVVVLVVGVGEDLVVVRTCCLFLLGTLLLLGDVRSFNLLTRCAMYSLVS